MFCSYNGKIVNTDNIKYIVWNHFRQFGYIYVHYTNYESECVKGADAIQIVERLAPEILEELIPVTGSWAIHNLIGHPLMQIFLWLRLPRAANWFHDKTIPKLKIITE